VDNTLVVLLAIEYDVLMQTEQINKVPMCKKCNLPTEVVTSDHKLVSWCECKKDHNIKSNCVICGVPIPPSGFFSRGNWCQPCISSASKYPAKFSEEATGIDYKEYLRRAGYNLRKVLRNKKDE